jgi:hypothetical protein
MKPLIFNFYRAADLLGRDGNTLDYSKLESLRSVDSLRAKPKAVLRMHLEHLGFEISKKRPDLETETLRVELDFRGKRAAPKRPVLTAFFDGKPVASRIVQLQTLDTTPFIPVLLRRNPELKDVDLIFTIEQANEGDES